MVYHSELFVFTVQALIPYGLNPVSFSLADGQCYAVFGKSGSGKSLLLRAIADLDPNAGDVLLDDRSRADFSAPSWRQSVVYVPAEAGWWADTVGAHFPDFKAAMRLLEALYIPKSCADWPILRLSTGERQRLALIRAFLLKPRVLLLDEPTSGLDANATESVEGLINDYLADGMSVLWVTHDMVQAKRVAKRGLSISDGTVTEVAL